MHAYTNPNVYNAKKMCNIEVLTFQQSQPLLRGNEVIVILEFLIFFLYCCVCLPWFLETSAWLFLIIPQ